MQITVKRELEAIKRNQEKLENLFGYTKAEINAMNSRMNKAENK